MNENQYLNTDDENILFFAFRYALGRRTAAVSILVTRILNDWHKLRPETQLQMQDEIRRYPEMYGKLGDQCDIDEWQKVLDLTPDKSV
jgi:hypothetical protein